MRLFVFLLFPFFLSAQDTIRFKDKQMDVGTVVEIGVQEIRYTKVNNEKGPVYVRYKAEVDYIRFKNGEIQKFRDVYPVEVPAASATIPFQKIVRDGRELYYDEERLGETKLESLILSYPYPEKRDRLKIEFSQLKSFRQQQYWFGTAGPILAGIIFVGGAVLTVFAFDERPFKVGSIVAAGILIPTITLSIVSKTKRTKQFLKIAELYNAP